MFDQALSDPYGLLALSFFIGCVLSCTVIGLIESIKAYRWVYKHYSRKSGATKMCDRELRRRLRHRS